LSQDRKEPGWMPGWQSLTQYASTVSGMCFWNFSTLCHTAKIYAYPRRYFIQLVQQMCLKSWRHTRKTLAAHRLRNENKQNSVYQANSWRCEILARPWT